MLAIFFLPTGASGVSLLYLIIWYFAAGRKQARFVKEKYGKNYKHRSWTKPLLAAFGLLVAYILIVIFTVTGLNGYNTSIASKGGYPPCKSDWAAEQFTSVFDGSQYAKTVNLNAIDVVDQKKISESSDGKKLVCQAKLMLNNSHDVIYTFTFSPARDGQFYLEGKPVGQ